MSTPEKGYHWVEAPKEKNVPQTMKSLVLYRTAKFILFLKSKYTRLESSPNALLLGKIPSTLCAQGKKGGKTKTSTGQMGFLNK